MEETLKYGKLAHGLSWVLHPFLQPVYLMGVLLTMTTFALYPANVKFYLLWVVALYAILIPVLSLGVLHSLGRLSSYRVDDRRERLLPLLIGAVCYVLCALTLSKIPSAIFLRKFMVAAACCELLCFVVSLRWKISLHLTGMGAVVALLVPVCPGSAHRRRGALLPERLGVPSLLPVHPVDFFRHDCLPPGDHL